MKRQLADVISISRLFLIIPWMLCYVAGSALALPIMAVIILSDIVDGPVARKTGTAGPRGALLDASCDAVVLLTAVIVTGLSEPRYLGLAFLMALNFYSWAGYGNINKGRTYTHLGRYNGAACYVLMLIVSAGSWPALCMADSKGVIERSVYNAVLIMFVLSTLENSMAIYMRKTYA